MKVSVIVPVYNVKEYVGDCLRSILNQTWQNLEIIIADDGSTDGSGEICDTMAEMDSRIRVIHTHNQGVSAARNTCLRSATGDYIAPVDSDDLILPEYFSALVSACVDNDADVAICDFRTVKQDYLLNEEEDGIAGWQPGAKVFPPQECLEHIYHPISSGMSFDTWGKLYRRSLYAEAGMQYPAGRIHEDVAITYKLLYRAQRIAYLPQELYLYRLREGSIMHRPFYEERLAAAEATRGQCDFFLKEGEMRLSALAVNNHIRTLFSLLANVRESEGISDSDKKRMEQKLVKELQADCNRYLPQVEMSVARKIMYRTAAGAPVHALVQRLRMF